jgi:hypothetical protein
VIPTLGEPLPSEKAEKSDRQRSLTVAKPFDLHTSKRMRNAEESEN